MILNAVNVLSKMNNVTIKDFGDDVDISIELTKKFHDRFVFLIELSINNFFDIEEIVDRKFDEKNKPIMKLLRKLDRNINVIAKVLDRDIVHLRKHVDRVENHLSLSPLTSDY